MRPWVGSLEGKEGKKGQKKRPAAFVTPTNSPGKLSVFLFFVCKVVWVTSVSRGLRSVEVKRCMLHPKPVLGICSKNLTLLGSAWGFSSVQFRSWNK